MSPFDNYQVSSTDNSPNLRGRASPGKTLSKIVNGQVLAIFFGGLAVISILFLAYFLTQDKPDILLNFGNSANNKNNSATAELVDNKEDSQKLTQKDLEDQRITLSQQSEKYNNLELVAITQGQFTSQKVQATREKLGSESPTLQLTRDKKVKIEVKYSSIGDSDFQEASLHIKLSDGLAVVEDSMRDLFAGGLNLKVDNSLYSPKDNMITYGPGSGTKTASPMKVSESGIFSMTLEVKSTNSKNFGVASYIREKDGKIGQPSVFFIDLI